MWELLKNKNIPPKIEKPVIKEIKQVDTEDDKIAIEAVRMAKERADKKIITEKINFAGGQYE
jgi:hypothetical protein